MRTAKWMFLGALTVLVLSGQTLAVNIETVPIGNPGNDGKTYRYADDFNPGYVYETETDNGAVAYSYQMGKFEITVGQYVDFLNSVATNEDTYGLFNDNMTVPSNGLGNGCGIERTGEAGNYSYAVQTVIYQEEITDPSSDRAQRPVSHVSWADAARFANWMHNGQPVGVQGTATTEDGSYDLSGTQQYYSSGWTSNNTPNLNNAGEEDAWNDLNAAILDVARKPDATWVIPSDNEWYKAAYHSNGQAVNHVVPLSDPEAQYTDQYYDYPTATNDKPSNDLINPDPGNSATFLEGGSDWTVGPYPYKWTMVGQHANSGSPYGTFDQGGNVWEWVHEVVVDYQMEESMGYRGGSTYDYDYEMIAGQLYEGSLPAGEWDGMGFRLAVVPEPATLSLLGLGAVALIRRRRRT